MQYEMQSVSSRIWTRVAVSISCDDNHYTTGTSNCVCLNTALHNQRRMLSNLWVLHTSRGILSRLAAFLPLIIFSNAPNSSSMKSSCLISSYPLIISSYPLITLTQVTGAAEYTDCISAKGYDYHNDCSGYDTK